MYYVMCENLIWREFNFAIFFNSPNRQIKALAKISRHTVSDLLLLLHLISY